MGFGDYFDDPALPQDPIASALGQRLAEKIGDIAPLVTPERVAQFAQNPFAVGRDPAVLEAVAKNTPLARQFAESTGKFKEHMGNPTKINFPMPGDPPTDLQQYRALRGREAIAGLMPVSSEPLYPGQQANPFAGVNPAALTKLVNVGGTSSSSKSVSRTKGVKSMPGYDLALDTNAGRAEEAHERIGEAQAEAAKQKSLAMQGHETALRARQKAFEAKEADNQAAIAAQEAKASAIRAEVATMKEDPDRWWSSRSASQKAALGVAAALSGFVQGFRGQAGPNAVVAMTQKLIDRDLALQTRQIARKGKQAAEERGVVGDLYRRLGSMREAENQFRIMMTEQFKTKLDQISQTAAAPIARQNAELASAQLDQQIIGLKNRAFQQAQDRVTVTKSSSGSSRRAPLGSVLAKIAKANQPKPLPRPPNQVIEDSRMAEVARRKLDKVYSMTRDYWTGKHRLTPSAMSVKKQRLDLAAKQAAIALRNAAERGVMPEWDWKNWQGAVLGNWDNAADIKARLKDAHHLVGVGQTALIRKNSAYFNMAPLAKQEIEEQKKHSIRYGSGKGH